MTFRAVLIWLATRLPRLLQLLAVVSFLAAIAAGYVESQRNAARMLALRNPEPQAVTIQDFVPRQHQGLSGEANIIAQVDLRHALRIRYREGVSEARAVVFPLLSTLADRSQRPRPELMGYLYFAGPDVKVEPMSVERFLPRPLSQGPIGPIVALDGQPGAPLGLSRQLAGAFDGYQDRGFAEPVMITPFPEGRIAALSQPVASQARSLLLGLSAVLLVAGLWLQRILRGRVETRRLRTARAAGRTHRLPETARAKSRFSPLAEQGDLSGRRRRGVLDHAGLRGLRRLVRPD